ncbi:MAG TPA: cohesin domain-containing protein [Patescibacteria group bacterium]|nr:cohesin domain-containing protein [Patescibacteria group bacterium]
MNILISRTQIILYIAIFAVSSWILIHVLSLLGVFLALAYPIWWFFAPRQTVCLFCRSRANGQICPLCHRVISKTDSMSPKTFFSALFNGGILFAFSLVSIAIVVVESQFLHFLGFPPAKASVSFTIPTANTYRLGEIFPMKLAISGVDVPVNTVQADIAYDPQKLEIVNISTENSFATIFIQKEINNTVGYARLTGGLPNPGFSGKDGLFGTVYFKSKQPGVTDVRFLPTTMVLANDGKGSDVLKNFGTISYLVLPEKISDAEQAQENGKNNVLGASTSGTQMIFYTDEDVLGSKTAAKDSLQVNSSKQSTPGFFDVLGYVDGFIVSVWQKVLHV